MPRGKPGVPVTQPETRFLSEWIAARHPNDRVQLQPRLGGLTPEIQVQGLSANELRMLGVWRRYPDAILFYDRSVTIVEASLKPEPGHLGHLLVYAKLFPLTPEFSDFKDYRVDRLAVWAMSDLATAAVAAQLGIQTEVFTPAWIGDVISGWQARHQRAARLTP